MMEAPIAQVTRTLYQINSKENAKIPKLQEMMFFADNEEDEDKFPADAAAVAVALLAEKRCPAPFIAIWPTIHQAAQENSSVPAIRALRAESGLAWVLAPAIKDGRVEGVFSVEGGLHGDVRLVDIDRPFYRINVNIPIGKAFAYIEEMSAEITSSG